MGLNWGWRPAGEALDATLTRRIEAFGISAGIAAAAARRARAANRLAEPPSGPARAVPALGAPAMATVTRGAVWRSPQRQSVAAVV